ncbi:MAG: c-type cytochrome, partial [Rhodobacterales bacterium]
TATTVQAQEDQTNRGAYLTDLAGCVHCHTGPGGAAFAGGLTLNTPFGELVSPNITPDETGIKGWTLEDFKRALREGKNHDGAPLYPAMPFTAYTKLSDDDVASIWSYISTLDPVENKVDVIQLPFPYNIRTAVGVWQAMFFDPGRFEPNPDLDDQMNRGKYIVEALAHCSSCHTPRNALGAQIDSERFQGAQTEQWYAPNITRGPNSVLTKWDEEGLINFLNGNHANNIPAFGPMGQVTDSLSKVSTEDVAAIAAYMLRGQPKPEDAEKIEPKPLSEEELALSDSVFEANCVSCHGKDGAGAPGVAANLVGNGGVVANAPDNVVNVLLQGIAPNDDYGVMPSFADVLSNEEIAAAANHVRRSWGNAGALTANADLVAYLRDLNGPPDPSVKLAVNCRSVADETVTTELKQALSERAQTTRVETDGLATLAADYANARPELSEGERLTAMSGLYCRELAIAHPDLSVSQFTTAQMAFLDAVSEAAKD